MEWDPTLLSRANLRYSDTVKSLVFASSWAGLSSDELEAFQSEYRRNAFICTVRNCERSRFGYSSVLELKDHQTRQHTAGFKCPYEHCPYNGIGFTKSRSLRAHVKKGHLRDLPAIPKTLKRKRQAGQNSGQPDVQTPQALGSNLGASALPSSSGDGQAAVAASPVRLPREHFTPAQLNLLRQQIQAFKMLSKNFSVPVNLQHSIFQSRQERLATALQPSSSQ